MNLTIHPLTTELWPALEDLFGEGGASNGCWCMYWRIGSKYQKRAREENRRAFRTIVTQGPPPGLLALDGERAVGWCQLTPRDDLRWLDRTRFFERVDDVQVWSISCFYVRRGYRGRGVMSALIAAALRAAKRANVRALEAYPVDAARRDSSSNLFTGTASTFRRAGFKDRGAPRTITTHHASWSEGERPILLANAGRYRMSKPGLRTVHGYSTEFKLTAVKLSHMPGIDPPIYAHVLNQGPTDVRNHADQLDL